ncbi:hypothetical protein [Leptolyngbya iicbica]|uniref:Uncharacterized protein n=2 Tax=Cyanophyceae TaxID=3028117 RepID=A0A4Q7EAY3_9CYAN|nr:hypothetical protein [Leptolyngbya sp. LK]RZM79679.1 hypothetical protein DYY88_13335 [Leptolyngbya sp. LK]
MQYSQTRHCPTTCSPCCFLRYREAEPAALMSTGDWALAARNRDRIAGVLFWEEAIARSSGSLYSAMTL